MKVVFLDIDGVLNSSAYFEEIHKQGKEEGHTEISDYHLQMLAKIVHTTNAKIVLSSTWRELEDSDIKEVQEMWQYLIDELARYGMEIYDKTPMIHMNRPLEIKTWIQQHKKEVESFVSLDDDFSKENYDKFGIGCHLIHTRFFCNKVEDGGLQQLDVEKAIQILNKKNKGENYGK